MVIKALIFDLDDTLWPIAPLIQHAELTLHEWIGEQLPAVVAQYSIEDLRNRRLALVKTDAQFSFDLWALRHTLLKQVFAEHGAHHSLADQAMQVFATARNQVSLYEDVMPALNVLKQHFVLGSISNGFADVTAVGLHQHFSASIAAHTFGCAKPDAKIFHAMAQSLNLEPTELMYIGDDLRLDVQGAQQAGLSGVWLNRRNLSLEEAGHPNITPDLIVKDLQELLQKLL